jgi:hypothetical protein
LTREEMHLPVGIRRDSFPGTIDDRISMLLYNVPTEYADPQRLRIIAEKMRDYTVFDSKLRHLLTSDGTIDEYMQSLHFQIVKNNSTISDDGSLGDFPSFEIGWRRSLSADLQRSLVPSPQVTSSEIHRVLPIGILPVDAIQCFQSALPMDLTTPYILTVESKASDDKCGSIGITQKTHHIIMNITANVDPGIMTEVCRELRVGYRSVVQELSHTNTQLSTIDAKFSAKLSALDTKFSALHNEIIVLKDLVKAGAGDRKRSRDETEQICSKKNCMKLVTDRFSSGVLKKQCPSCLSFGNPRKQHTAFPTTSPRPSTLVLRYV